MESEVKRDRNKFYVQLDNNEAKITFNMPKDDVIELNHTEVPEAFRGKGIAEKMAKFALEYSRENNLKVIPSCRFVNSYIQRHKEYQDLVWKH